MSGWKALGQIRRLQIQRESLKVDADPYRYYNPAPILSAPVLHVADGLVLAETDDAVVVDVHCASHPRTRNRGNGNMLSVLFTGHYDKIRNEFGNHVRDGLAGENILVELDNVLDLDDVAGGLRIEGDGGRSLDFGEIAVATPCVEFSRFCLGDCEADPRETAKALKFLDKGTRGYYAYVSDGLPAEIRVGDELYARR